MESKERGREDLELERDKQGNLLKSFVRFGPVIKEGEITLEGNEEAPGRFP